MDRGLGALLAVVSSTPQQQHVLLAVDASIGLLAIVSHSPSHGGPGSTSSNPRNTSSTRPKGTAGASKQGHTSSSSSSMDPLMGPLQAAAGVWTGLQQQGGLPVLWEAWMEGARAGADALLLLGVLLRELGCLWWSYHTNLVLEPSVLGPGRRVSGAGTRV